MKRDTALDEIRTLLAVYTIWAHSMSWSGLLSTPSSPSDFNVWGLTPMVAFFFLIGATNSLGRKRTPIDFYKTRLTRILTPYLFFAIGALLMCIMVSYLSGTTYPSLVSQAMHQSAEIMGTDVNFFSPGSPIYWFLPVDKSIIYAPPGLEMLKYHLWFLPMYLGIVLIFPFMRSWYEKLRFKWIPLAVMLAAIPVFRVLKMLYWSDNDFIGPLIIGLPMSFVCYCFWTYLGLYYSRMRHPTKKMKRIAVIIGICGIFLVCFMLKLPDILARLGITVSDFTARFIYYIPGCIANHFPPNPLFMAYNFAAFPLLYVLAPYILRAVRFLREKSKLINGVFSLYENSYLIIYLFSAFAFCFVRWTLCGLGVFDLFFKNEYIGAIIMQLIMIPVCGYFGKILAPLETFKFKK